MGLRPCHPALLCTCQQQLPARLPESAHITVCQWLHTPVKTPDLSAARHTHTNTTWT